MASSSSSRVSPAQCHHRRAGHVMVAYENRLYIWGGYMELPRTESNTFASNTSCYHKANEIWMFDPFLDKWTRKICKGEVPYPLSGACAAVHDQHMYLFGGWAGITSEDGDNNLNFLWRLHLPSLKWKRLSPKGTPPFPCDKAACWVHNNRFFVFGGYGRVRCLSELLQAVFVFMLDGYYSAWTDQLVYYDIEKDEWIWPETKGVKPTPRAAHAADVCGDKIYIFGGRLESTRMNELHCLNLNNWTWSGNLTDPSIPEVPEGRSWHTFKFVSENKAVVYGGFNSNERVLRDIWVLDVTSERWCQSYNPKAEPRLWHTAAVAHPGEVMFYGGIKNNLLDHTKPKDHAEGMLLMRFSPPSLQRVAIEAVCKAGDNLRAQWKLLPQILQHVLTVRLSPSSSH